MATAANNGQTLGGYELDFVQEIPPGCECAICQLPMKDPLIIKSCGHRFCNVCLQPVLRQDPALCPLDRQPIPKDKVTLDMEWKTKITSLAVLCPNKGCEWVGELAKLETHESKDCAFAQVCPYVRCKMRLNYATYNLHLKSCTWRTINCNNCKQDFSLCQLREHISFCRSRPNSHMCVCGTMFATREQIAQHEIAGCPFKRSVAGLNLVGVIPCPFAIFGCPAKIRPCDINSHYISFVTLHLWFTANTVDKTRVAVETTRKQTEYAATTLGFLREELQKSVKETQELKESSETQAREIQELKEQLNAINDRVENRDLASNIDENQSVVEGDKEEEQVMMKTLDQDVRETQDKIKAINEVIVELQATTSVAMQDNIGWRKTHDRITAKVEVQQQDLEDMKDQISALQRQVLQFEKSGPHMFNQISALQQQVLQFEKSGPHMINEDCSSKIESQSKCCSEAHSRLEVAVEMLKEEIGVLSTRSFRMEGKFLDQEENTFCWYKQTKEQLRSKTNENSKLFEAIQKELKELVTVKDEHAKELHQFAATQEKLTEACKTQDEQVELVRMDINEMADTLGIHGESARARQDIKTYKTTPKDSDVNVKTSRKSLNQNELMTEIHDGIDALKNDLKSVRGEFEVHMLNHSESNFFLNERMQKQIDTLSILANQRLHQFQKEQGQQKDRLENFESQIGVKTTLNQDFEIKQQTMGYTNANQPFQDECNSHTSGEQECFEARPSFHEKHADNVSLDVSTNKQKYKDDFAKHMEDIQRAVEALELTEKGLNKKDRIEKHSEDHTARFETVKDVTKLKHRE